MAVTTLLLKLLLHSALMLLKNLKHPRAATDPVPTFHESHKPVVFCNLAIQPATTIPELTAADNSRMIIDIQHGNVIALDDLVGQSTSTIAEEPKWWRPP